MTNSSLPDGSDTFKVPKIGNHMSLTSFAQHGDRFKLCYGIISQPPSPCMLKFRLTQLAAVTILDGLSFPMCAGAYRQVTKEIMMLPKYVIRKFSVGKDHA